MKFSKAEIDRLGQKIRDQKDIITDATLNDLQDYRISYKEALSNVFNSLCSHSSMTYPTSIVTYRVKRFESIIGKLKRYPEMRFSRMWDIGGCRCIFRQEKHIYVIKDKLLNDSSIEIVKEYDYLQDPQKDGYRSLHLFVKFIGFEQVIEVQLRSIEHHNWATLVEITDVLYDTKIKELGNEYELGRFHHLLSKVNRITFDEKEEIVRIIRKYNYVEKLNAVFSRNYLKVRKQWFEIESQKGHKYFLIETTKEEVPKIESFNSALEAEEAYFAVYKSSQNANIVLTHLCTPSYNQISIAYSNYLLTFHSILDESYDIIESLIFDSIKKGRYFRFYKLYEMYYKLLLGHSKNILDESRELDNLFQQTIGGKGKKKGNPKEKEWMMDVQKQIAKGRDRGQRLRAKFIKNLPDNRIQRLVIARISKHVHEKYSKMFQKIIS